MNKTLAVAIVALVVSIGAVLFPNTTERVVETVTLGSGSGQNQSSLQFMDGGLTYGSGCYSTSTGGILTSKNLENGCIYGTAAGAGQAVISFTLPASTTMSMIQSVGSCHEWYYDASDLTAATTTTFVAGTGHDVVGLDATGAGTGADVVDGAEFARMTSCREKNGDVVTFMQEYIHAD